MLNPPQVRLVLHRLQAPPSPPPSPPHPLLTQMSPRMRRSSVMRRFPLATLRYSGRLCMRERPTWNGREGGGAAGGSFISSVIH